MNQNLNDMKKMDNEQLRELLANPEVYTPEAVHQAAIELSFRHAMPRYYTRIPSRLQHSPIKVQWSWNLDFITKVQILFSERNLIKYCLMVCLFDSLALIFRIYFFV